MMLEVETLYDLGDLVYFLTDEQQRSFVVTEICIRPNAFIEYECSRPGMIQYAQAGELTKQKVLA